MTAKFRKKKCKHGLSTPSVSFKFHMMRDFFVDFENFVGLTVPLTNLCA